MGLAVEALRRVVTSVPGYEVAWIARDGEQAIKACGADVPDLILMDLIMPVMDGVEATRRIMQKTPCPILVVTATVEGNASLVFEAMGHGALDAISTPALGADGKLDGGDPLLVKIATLKKLNDAPSLESQPDSGAQAPAAFAVPPLLAIGASSGGPKAVSEVLCGLPDDFQGAVVVIQHIDDDFAGSLAQWLDSLVTRPVRLARQGDLPRAGEVLVARGHQHLVMESSLTLAYTPEPKDYPYLPSVDAFLKSAARRWPLPAVGVVLTGMGRDGGQGLLAARQAGWRTLAQDQATSVVYGMPKAAAELNAADQILPLNDIAMAAVTALANGQALRRD